MFTPPPDAGQYPFMWQTIGLIGLSIIGFTALLLWAMKQASK